MNHRTHMVLMVGLAVLAVAQAVTGFGGGWVLYIFVGGYAWMTYLMMRGMKHQPIAPARLGESPDTGPAARIKEIRPGSVRRNP
jgi:hypothetical protein